MPLLSGEEPNRVWGRPRPSFALEMPWQPSKFRPEMRGREAGPESGNRACARLFGRKSPAKRRDLRRNGPVRVQFPYSQAGIRQGTAHEPGCAAPYLRSRPRGGRDARAPRRRHLCRRDLRRRRLQPRDPRCRGNPGHRHRPRPVGHYRRLRSGRPVGRPADPGRGPLLQPRRGLRRAGRRPRSTAS